MQFGILSLPWLIWFPEGMVHSVSTPGVCNEIPASVQPFLNCLRCLAVFCRVEAPSPSLARTPVDASQDEVQCRKDTGPWRCSEKIQGKHALSLIFVIAWYFLLQDFGCVQNAVTLNGWIWCCWLSNSHGRHPFVQQEDLRLIFWPRKEVKGPNRDCRNKWLMDFFTKAGHVDIDSQEVLFLIDTDTFLFFFFKEVTVAPSKTQLAWCLTHPPICSKSKAHSTVQSVHSKWWFQSSSLRGSNILEGFRSGPSGWVWDVTRTTGNTRVILRSVDLISELALTCASRL